MLLQQAPFHSLSQQRNKLELPEKEKVISNTHLIFTHNEVQEVKAFIIFLLINVSC